MITMTENTKYTPFLFINYSASILVFFNNRLPWKKSKLFEKGGLGTYNYLHSATLYWSACPKPIKWIVTYMYMCVRTIDYSSVSTIFLLDFPTVWYVLLFIFNYDINKNITQATLKPPRHMQYYSLSWLDEGTWIESYEVKLFQWP